MADTAKQEALNKQLDELKGFIQAGKKKSECCTSLKVSSAKLQTLHNKLMIRDKQSYEFVSGAALKDQVVVGKGGAITICKSRIPNFITGDAYKIKVEGTTKIILTKV